VERAVVVKRVVAGLIVTGALVYAIEGGEFSSIDLIRQRRTQARLKQSIDSLERVVDSLRRYEDKVQHDPATQERIAREVFGMVRGDKEILYRFADSVSRPDSQRRSKSPPSPP
jgi:cell division protein FtsB